MTAERQALAQDISAVLEKLGKHHVALSVFKEQLPSARRKALGLTKGSKVTDILKALGTPPDPFKLVKHKGGSYFFDGQMSEMILEAVRRRPGRPLGDLNLPFPKTRLWKPANELLERMSIIAKFSSEKQVVLFPSPETAVLVRADEQPGTKRQDPIREFRQAYEQTRRGKPFVYIYKIRRELGWSRDQFDDLLDSLMVQGVVAAFPADPSKLTKDEVQDSFAGRDGELYLHLTWRKEP